MKHVVSLIIFLNLLGISCSGQESKPSVTFYLMTYPEQMQLYMSAAATDDLLSAKDSQNRIVFIYAFSEDSHPKVNANGLTKYYKANEQAAKNVVEILSNTHQYNINARNMWLSDWKANTIQFEGHKVLCHSNKNISMYFLRLPGESAKGNELEQLYNEKSAGITTTDKSTTYKNWKDLVKTVCKIVGEETKSKAYKICVNTLDTRATEHHSINNNKYIAQLTADVFRKFFKPEKVMVFKASDITSLATNMSPEQIIIQAAMCAAADYAKRTAGQPSHWQSTVRPNIGKTYKTTIQ